MAAMIALFSFGGAVGLGLLTWVLWRNFQKQQRLLRVLTGVIMAITGLAALLSGICGAFMLGS